MISDYINSAKVPMSKGRLGSGMNNRGLAGRLTAAVAGAFLLFGTHSYAQNAADPNATNSASTNTTTLSVSTTATVTTTSNTNVVSFQEYELIRKDRDALRDERDKLELENCELQHDYSEALKQINSIDNSLQERANKITGLENSLAEVNERHTKLRDKYETLEKDKNNVEAERNKIRKEYVEVQRERKRLSGELKAQKNSYRELSNKFDDLTGRNSALNSDLSQAKTTITGLESQVTTLNTQVAAYQQKEAELNARDIARRAEDERALKEGALVYQFTTSPAYTFPEFPWATAIFDSKESTFGEIVEVPFASNVDGRFIDSFEELRKVAEGVSKVYKATFPNRTAFEQLAADAGMDANFVASVEGGSQQYTAFDALAQMVHDYGYAKKNNPRNPVVLSIDDKDQAVIFGSYSTLKRVKGGSL